MAHCGRAASGKYRFHDAPGRAQRFHPSEQVKTANAPRRAASKLGRKLKLNRAPTAGSDLPARPMTASPCATSPVAHPRALPKQPLHYPSPRGFGSPGRSGLSYVWGARLLSNFRQQGSIASRSIRLPGCGATREGRVAESNTSGMFPRRTRGDAINDATTLR